MRLAQVLQIFKAPIGVKYRGGQAIVLLLAMLVAMVAMVVWLLNTHTAVISRLRAQDAGDPVALAAAKWQAAGLNLIGELNLIHAYMLADDKQNVEAALALHELQQRVSLTVPVLALQSAQHVAQKNGTQVLPEGRDFLRDCLRFIHFPDLYEGATEDFHQMIASVLRAGDIYAFPISAIYSDANTLLGNQDFYEAVLADDYCWFWFYAYRFLETYRSRHDFGEVADISTEIFFGLDVNTAYFTLETLRTQGAGDAVLNQQLMNLGHPPLPPPQSVDLENDLSPANEQQVLHPWMVYGASWTPWEQMRRHNLPIRADVRPEYDSLGASAVTSTVRDNYPWMASAKPFGSVGGYPPRTTELVLGGFDAVRLVPLDSLGTGIRPFEVEWYRHIYFHIREYRNRGQTVDNCRYCRALRKWDSPTFRMEASEWLSLYGHTCRRPRPGCGDSGGSTYAH